MNSAMERTRSFWLDETPPEAAPPLGGPLAVDVAIIGSGIAGLTTAYLLAREGQRVAVIDSGRIAGGMSARTTAHLSNALDDRWSELIRLRGADDATIAAASHSAAIDRIEEIQRAESIDCDFARIDGYLYRVPGDPADILDRELAACHQIGLANVTLLERAPLTQFDTGPALRFPRQGRFHPLKYLNGLARAVRDAGGQIFGDTRAISVHGGRQAIVETAAGHRVEASYAVVATNTPVNDRIVTHTKQAPYRTYVIAGAVERGSVPDALYWDTGDPYHYVRLQPREGGSDLLIVGGEDHKTGQADDGARRFAALERWARDRFPIGTIEYGWSGQVMEPIDFLGYIGRNPGEDNVFVATGDSGMGMTHGTIAGIIISSLVLSGSHEWERLYAVNRITPKAAGDFAKENLNVAVRFADYVTPGDISSSEELKPGQGAILRRGLRKVAVFRDAAGQLHERSAICPHMGCIVSWNTLEGCWDCPCHGSQFAAEDGSPLNGPAASGLAELGREHGGRRTGTG